MQIRVKLLVLNENTAKHLHLHLDPYSHPAVTWALRHVRLLSKNTNKRHAKRKTDERVFSHHVSYNKTTLASNF